MKKISFLILAVICFNQSRAQNSWTQKTSFLGTARWGAVAFSIGDKGYIGTGNDGYGRNDFWEYDPGTDAWTQRASIGFTGRYGSVGFSIGDKGYIGTGAHDHSNYTNDFWEYDPVKNAWTQRAPFLGKVREFAAGFSIGSKGYIGTGLVGNESLRDFWEYDPATNRWTRKADFGGPARWGAVGFSIGSKGYIGTGDIETNDFWEYDPASDTWIRKTDFAGSPRWGAVGFSIGGKGYIGTGFKLINYFGDFWEYDTTADTWTRKVNFEGTARYNAVGFSIGGRGYIGTGLDSDNVSFFHEKNDFWEYTPDNVCEAPNVMSASNLTSSSSAITWNKVAGALGYTVRYKISGSSHWTIVPALNNSKQLKNLLPATEYVYQVKSICNVHPFVSAELTEKEFFTTNSLRLAPNNSNEFEIYPNPAGNELNVILPSAANEFTIQIFDLQSRLIALNAEFKDNSIQLNTSSLPNGFYTLQIIAKKTGQIEVGSFVKQ